VSQFVGDYGVQLNSPVLATLLVVMSWPLQYSRLAIPWLPVEVEVADSLARIALIIVLTTTDLKSFGEMD
jgi:hypothetical protein